MTPAPYSANPFDAKTTEMALCPVTVPQSDWTGSRGAFQIVDDQCWLRGAIDEELGGSSFNMYAHVGPGVRNQIDVRFVHSWRFAAKAIEVELRWRNVLG